MENSDSLWRPLKKGKAVSRRRRRSEGGHGGVRVEDTKNRLKWKTVREKPYGEEEDFYNIN